jgi:hypothetical protein
MASGYQSLVMMPLAARLAREGFRCHRFGYRGQGLRSPQMPANSCASRARSDPPTTSATASEDWSILRALTDHPELAVGNVVLLGTPARGSFSGRRLARHRIGRWMLGETQPLWHDRELMRWKRTERWASSPARCRWAWGARFGPLPGPNDGVVCVDETAIEGMSERITLRVGHSAMLVAPRVASQTAAFLREGKFLDEAG